MKQAQSHSYGKTWTPPVKAREIEVKTEPRLRLGKADSIYAEGPLPKFERDADAFKEKVNARFRPRSRHCSFLVFR